MKHQQGNPEELKQKFWRALADSPFVFLQLDGHDEGAVPMTAQLDEHADHAIWFFTSRDHHFAAGGPATCTFAGKNHDLFARFQGTLSEETGRERFEAEWSNFVRAYFPGGKNDPNLLMLRMDLGAAEIWDADLGMLTGAKMALGKDVREEAAAHHAETTL